MAAPSYVPSSAAAPTSYRSPPRRPAPWSADRPGDVVGLAPPSGPAHGNPGPDQGYGLTLARRFADQLVLAEGEHLEDVLAGGCAVALRRASMFGRAPVVHDVRLAFGLFGFLDEAPAELVEWRRPRFEELAHHHHYGAQRRLADLVPEATLRRSPDDVIAAIRDDWRGPLGL